MFIKLTNASPDFAGDPLIINMDKVISIYERHESGGSLSTVIYANDQLSWIVEESIEKIHSLIKAATN